MLATFKLVGKGVPGDEYRVNVPTYTLVGVDVDKGTITVDIPDEVHGLTDDVLLNEKAEATPQGPHYKRLSSYALKQMHRHFDERYREHKGEFRPEVV